MPEVHSLNIHYHSNLISHVFFMMLQNCLLHTAKCLKFHCVIFNLRRNHEATIRIRARYDSHSYVCVYGPVVKLNCKVYSSDCIHLLCIVYLAYFVKHATYFLSCSVFWKANRFWSVSDYFFWLFFFAAWSNFLLIINMSVSLELSPMGMFQGIS